MTVFEDGFIKGTALLPIGGNHLTKDISIVLRTSTEDAEMAKIKHGQAFYDLARKTKCLHCQLSEVIKTKNIIN